MELITMSEIFFINHKNQLTRQLFKTGTFCKDKIEEQSYKSGGFKKNVEINGKTYEMAFSKSGNKVLYLLSEVDVSKPSTYIEGFEYKSNSKVIFRKTDTMIII